MTNSRLSIRRAVALLRAATTLALTATPALTQTPAPAPSPSQQAPPAVPAPTQPAATPRPQPIFYRNLILLDPAHGGPDPGARIGDAQEKSVTLAFAQRLRPMLAAQGFTVATTRDADLTDALSSDQRAGTANHVRPLACLVLHATSSGSGIHIVTSALAPAYDKTLRAIKWSDAQSESVALSLKLANEIGVALTNAHLPATLFRSSVPPLDNLTCAAVAIEVAPLTPQGASPSPATDAAYQQHAAEAIALGLASFRNHNAPASAPAAPPTPPPAPRAAPPVPSAAPSAPATNPSTSPQSAPQPAMQPAPSQQPTQPQGAPR